MRYSLANSYFGFDPNSMTLFIKSVPKNISRWEIKQVIKFKNLIKSEIKYQIKQYFNYICLMFDIKIFYTKCFN